MNLRTTLFWIHLACGVCAGLVIGVLSITGVLLTFERQVVAWADRASLEPVTAGTTPLPLAELVDAVTRHAPDAEITAITIDAAPDRPVAVALGRERTVFVDPGNAAVLGEGAPTVHALFDFVTRLHRWFALEGVARDRARAVTGAANLVFAFLVLSGAWLWLPRFWRASQLKKRLWFRRDYTSGKARDWTWHHVYGAWLWLPLLLVVLTGAVFSYSWANALVYRVFGEEPPQRRGPPGAPRAEFTDTPVPVRLDRLLAAADTQAPGWRTLTLQWPLPASGEATLTLDGGNGGQPQRQVRLRLDAQAGEVFEREGFGDLSPARRARLVIRRLHTGEVFGWPGQAVAGLASLAGVMLTWTGLALAWRRLVRPLLARSPRNRLVREPGR